MWKHSHNEVHHTYTNVLGKDHDLGYGIMRVDEDQLWKPFYLAQPLWNLINACLFQYGIAAYDLEIGKYLKGRTDKDEFHRQGKKVLAKVRRHLTRDYVLHPLLSGPSALTTVTANLTANVVRNLWTHSVIMCGHFPDGVQTFEKTSIEGETRGQWNLRQMLGSANITGNAFLHFMTGNLSFQIEHHLFPDLPSNRYQEIAPKVQELFERYGLTYTSGPVPRQVASAWRKVFRLSLPNDFPRKASEAIHPAAIKDAIFTRSRRELQAASRRRVAPTASTPQCSAEHPGGSDGPPTNFVHGTLTAGRALATDADPDRPVE